MTEYIKIENEVPVGFVMDKLPEKVKLEDGSWISGFNLLTDSQVGAYGYYKVIQPKVGEYDETKVDLIIHPEFTVNNINKTVTPKFEFIDKVISEQNNDVVITQPINVDLQVLTLTREALRANTESI